MPRFHAIVGTLIVISPLLGAAQDTETLHINPERLQSLLTELSRFGRDDDGGISRLAFSEADREARSWLLQQMKEAGLEAWMDQAANLHGRRPGSDDSLPAILFGSHIDSVPQGGNFDGGLGSIGALEVMLTLQDENIVTRHPMEMVVWSNEEGARYGGGVFGARIATRGSRPGELDREEDGVSLAEWLRRYGLDPDRIDSARIDRDDYAAFIEIHVEQGPVLYRRGIQIGVVQGIVAIDRYGVTIEGAANHAGTTPMNERRDAMVAAARLIQAVREEVMAKPGTQVGNVGWLRASPGAANVVPGKVELTIELRALDREVLDDVIARIRARADAIATLDKVTFSFDGSGTSMPVPTGPWLQDVIEEVAQEAGFTTLRMPSGAGHDAQVLGRFGIPIGMIFVPSQEGISHSPKEWTEWEDCARGVEVLYRTILELDRR
jgi:N-carbamoyl-L-amino-acid hydrolase